MDIEVPTVASLHHRDSELVKHRRLTGQGFVQFDPRFALRRFQVPFSIGHFSRQISLDAM